MSGSLLSRDDVRSLKRRLESAEKKRAEAYTAAKSTSLSEEAYSEAIIDADGAYFEAVACEWNAAVYGED